MKLNDYIKSSNWLVSLQGVGNELHTYFKQQYGRSAKELYGENVILIWDGAKNWKILRVDSNGNKIGSDPEDVEDTNEYDTYLRNTPQGRLEESIAKFEDTKKLFEKSPALNDDMIASAIYNRMENTAKEDALRVVKENFNNNLKEIINKVKPEEWQEASEKLVKKLGISDYLKKVNEITKSFKGLLDIAKPENLIRGVLSATTDEETTAALMELISFFL